MNNKRLVMVIAIVALVASAIYAFSMGARLH